MSSPNLWDDSSSDDELPAEYQKVIIDDQIWYYNCLTGSQQKDHPLTGHIKRVSSTLPPGWIKSNDEAGNSLYVNLKLNCTSYIDPRLGWGQNIQTKSNPNYIRFKYDKFSSANDILLGKDLRNRHIVITGSGCGLGLWIAKLLVSHGAIVICASTYCPPDAIALNESNDKLYTYESGKLFWIRYDPTYLQSVVQFVETYKSLGWPLHVCILAADSLAPANPTHFVSLPIFNYHIYLSKLTRLWTQSRLYRVIQTGTNFIRVYFGKLVNYFLPEWIPPNSCECNLFKNYQSMSLDGWEISIQINYLAQALLIRSLIPILKQTANQSAPLQDVYLRIVILTNSGSKCSKLTDSHEIDLTHLVSLRPSSLVNRLEQYINAKFCLLLLGHELSNQFSQQYIESHQTRPIEIYVCYGSHLFSTHCTGLLCKHLSQPWTNGFLFIVHSIYLTLKPFCRSIAQVASSPILCAVEASATFNRSIHISGKRLRSILITNCRPTHFVKNQNDLLHIDLMATKLWDMTEQLLIPFIKSDR